MKALFENLFYRTYLVALTNKYNTHHLDSAIMMFCIFQALNVCGILFWLEYYNIYNEHIEKYKLLLFGLVWNVCNFLYFYKHFERIKLEYADEKIEQKQTGFIVLGIYILFTIVFIALPMYLMKK